MFTIRWSTPRAPTATVSIPMLSPIYLIVCMIEIKVDKDENVMIGKDEHIGKLTEFPVHTAVQTVLSPVPTATVFARHRRPPRRICRHLNRIECHSPHNTNCHRISDKGSSNPERSALARRSNTSD